MNFLKAIALATVPVCGVFLCILLFQISGAVQDVRSDERAAAAETIADEQALTRASVHTLSVADSNVAQISVAATGTLHSANSVLKTVNRPCEAGKACGTLADVAKTLNTVRGTFGQIEIAANHEDRNLDKLDAQEEAVFADTHKTLSDADAFVASPALLDTLKNVDASSKSVADSTAQADAILVDARIEADKLAHPPKKKLTLWGALEAGGDFVRHFMPSIF